MGGVGNIIYVANPLLEICKESGYDFITISDIDYNKEYETKKWTPYTWVDDMLSCDVALCYNDPVNFPAKSNVKVTTAMALGLPVIANSIESYKEAIIHEYSGYIAQNKDDWVKYLKLLKSKELRATIGLRAQNYAFERYNIQKICLDFISMISNIL
jgi:glycosyltransferase involved in cell wall biosynthesis